MTATLSDGHRTWALQRDEEGHRTYRVLHQVTTNDPLDGPQIVMNTPGLPIIGSFWNFDNDSDIWAFCYPTMKVTPRTKNEPNKVWDVEQIFSTKPLHRCQDISIENPLLEPAKISGSFVKYTKEVFKDRLGNILKSSSHETFHGPQVEFDANRPTVRIEKNVTLLGLDVFSAMVDTVNDATLWGLGPRQIKLSNVSWERNLYGICTFYYTRQFEFDVNSDTFDRTILDTGTKVLNGEWDKVTGDWVLKNIGGSPPDKTNPKHFIRYKDRNGENARVILDGNGVPANTAIAGSTGTSSGDAALIEIEHYTESNFLLLGIPTTL